MQSDISFYTYTMKVSQSDLREKLISAAQKFVDQDAAEYFADECIEGHLRKIPRSNPIKSTIGDLVASNKASGKSIEYSKDLGATLMIDFNGHGPLVFLRQIHDEIKERTEKYGVCFVSFTNSNGIHTLHHWVQGLAKQGIMSVVAVNGGPEAVVPYNGTRGVFGTNPMAFGIPGLDGNIHCVDMATSEAPFFEIMNAHRNKKDLREGVAVDQEGNPTTKTADALDTSTSEDDPVANLLPMGGSYKGYYLVYLLELLTSGLIGSPSSPEMSADFIPEEHGAILIAFNPKAMGTESNLDKSVVDIHETLKEQKPKAETTIPIPGAGNNSRYDKGRDEDIDVPDDSWQKLQKLFSE